MCAIVYYIDIFPALSKNLFPLNKQNVKAVSKTLLGILVQ